MKSMKRVIFVGNRCGVLEALLTFPELELAKAYVVEHSPLHENFAGKAPVVVLGHGDKNEFFHFGVHLKPKHDIKPES